MLDWLLGYAVRLEYGDNGTSTMLWQFFQQAGPKHHLSTRRIYLYLFFFFFAADKYKGVTASQSAAGGKSENPLDAMDCKCFSYRRNKQIDGRAEL